MLFEETAYHIQGTHASAQLLTPESTPSPRRRPVRRRAAATPSPSREAVAQSQAFDDDSTPRSRPASRDLRTTLFMNGVGRASSNGAVTPQSEEEL